MRRPFLAHALLGFARMPVSQREWTDPKTGEAHSAWRVRVTFNHPDGRVTKVRKHAEVNTRKGAEAEERAIIGALLDGTHGNAPTPRTFEALVTEYLEDRKPHVKESTFADYSWRLEHYVLPRFGTKTLDQVDVGEVLKFKLALGKRLKPGGVNGALRILRAVLNFAESRGYILEAPEIEMVEEEEPDEAELFLTEEETALFLETAARLDPAWHPFFVVAFRTGSRVGELIALQVGDVALTTISPQIHLRRRSYAGKVGSPGTELEFAL